MFHFLKSKGEVKISLCVPVYNSEKFLAGCLDSVKNQVVPDGFTQKNFLEVIVVDDGSQGCGREFLSAKEIVSKFKKSVAFSVRLVSHSQNKGLVEARRTAVYEAKGEYVLILDSDDTLPQNALLQLYEAAVKTDADIVQGRANVCFAENVKNQLDEDSEKIEKFRKSRFEKANKMVLGELKDSEIFDGFVVQKNHTGFLWGKLYRRELYLEALEHIPPIFCTMAEDLLQYFWIAKLASKYVGIDSVVYNYCINTGISSNTIIDDISRWEQVCSTSSVFTTVFTELQENPEIAVTENQLDSLKILCRQYLCNNLVQLKTVVSPEIAQQAYDLLCDYWGEDFVKEMEEKVKS